MTNLKEYSSFHSMKCKPNHAIKCIQSFRGQNGCILFAPSYYYDEIQEIIETKTKKNMNTTMKNTGTEYKNTVMMMRNVMAKYDASKSLNLFTYYLFVFISFTGFCTIFNMTDVVEVEEFTSCNDTNHTHNNRNDKDCKDGNDSNDNNIVWPIHKRKDNERINHLLHSKHQPLIQFHDSIFQYLENHETISKNNFDHDHDHDEHATRVSKPYNAKDEKDENMNMIKQLSQPHSEYIFRIQRKFEYYFKLIGLHVIMIHLSSSTCTNSNNFNNSNSNKEDYKEGYQVRLHLVEIYHINNPFLRNIFKAIFCMTGIFLNYWYGNYYFDSMYKKGSLDHSCYKQQKEE